MLTRAQLDQADEFAVMQCARRESREEGIERGIEIGIPKGIEIGIPKGKELGRLEADVENYQRLKNMKGMSDDGICEFLGWDSARLEATKRAVTSPKLEVNQENQTDRTVE